MLATSCVRYTYRLAAALVALRILSAGALAQSAPPTHPSGSVTIHQVQIAFIGSGAVGGGPCTSAVEATHSNWEA
jgi:hypothetical protein